MATKIDIVGIKKLMNNGQYATCISYRKPFDIDIEFEDGTIVKTSKYCFLNGSVKNPNFWVGKKNRMNNGQYATIIAHRDYYDIDVRFEDGTIVTNRAVDKFRDGSIANPNNNLSTEASCLNVEVLQNNGQKAKCIAYRTNVDIDIEFEDGTIVKHKQKHSFLIGTIRNPNFNKHSVLGKTVLQNCGMSATCIAYRESQDIDVQFEDGTIVQHRYKYEFMRGMIQNHNMSSCLDQVVKMKNGQTAKCIAYRSYNDIDVQFEDGTIVEHVKKEGFIKGWLQNPFYNPKSCIDEERKMLNGQMAKCVAYRTSADIDVQFEDGTVVTSKTKYSFLRGEIANPNYDPYSCLNERRLMNNGMYATCIEYRNSEDIDVQFDDGTIVKHKVKSCFYSGSIANPNILSGSLPEQVIYYFLKKHFKNVDHNFRPNWLKNPATKSNLEIDIWIPSLKVGVEYDGVKWHNKETQKSAMKAELITKANEISKIYTFLENGCVVHDGPKHINYLLSSTSNTGEYVTLLDELEKYLNILLKDLGIDDKVVLTESLLNKIKSSKIVKEEFKSFEPETYMMSCGLRATIIAYRKSDDIDVEFEDGEIVRHKKLDSLRKGVIGHPKISQYDIIKKRANCIGVSIMQKCGMVATCIAYRKADDIDVRFEDGTIIEHRYKSHFYKGNVRYPVEKKYLNLTRTMNSGEKATIIVYRNYEDIDVRFEDGTIVTNRNCNEFLIGGIRNPNKQK